MHKPKTILLLACRRGCDCRRRCGDHPRGDELLGLRRHDHGDHARRHDHDHAVDHDAVGEAPGAPASREALSQHVVADEKAAAPTPGGSRGAGSSRLAMR